MQSEKNDGIEAHLAAIAADKRSARRVAEAVELTLIGIEHVLTPIVGPRGVAALFLRATHLAKVEHPWLPELSTELSQAMDPAQLISALALRSPEEAATAGAELLRDFHALLVTLIGPSLTERLLRSVWVNFSSGSSAQDNTQ